jgi:hypothetical protein
MSENQALTGISALVGAIGLLTNRPDLQLGTVLSKKNRAIRIFFILAIG